MINHKLTMIDVLFAWHSGFKRNTWLCRRADFDTFSNFISEYNWGIVFKIEITCERLTMFSWLLPTCIRPYDKPWIESGIERIGELEIYLDHTNNVDKTPLIYTSIQVQLSANKVNSMTNYAYLCFYENVHGLLEE